MVSRMKRGRPSGIHRALSTDAGLGQVLAKDALQLGDRLRLVQRVSWDSGHGGIGRAEEHEQPADPSGSGLDRKAARTDTDGSLPAECLPDHEELTHVLEREQADRLTLVHDLEAGALPFP